MKNFSKFFFDQKKIFFCLKSSETSGKFDFVKRTFFFFLGGGSVNRHRKDPSPKKNWLKKFLELEIFSNLIFFNSFYVRFGEWFRTFKIMRAAM